MVDGLIDVMEAGHVGQRLHIGLTNPSGTLIGLPHVIKTMELADRSFAHVMFAHLRRKLVELIRHGSFPPLSVHELKWHVALKPCEIELSVILSVSSALLFPLSIP